MVNFLTYRGSNRLQLLPYEVLPMGSSWKHTNVQYILIPDGKKLYRVG
jgi:hypothetical protein